MNTGNEIPIPCNLVSKISKEGNQYICLSIQITDTYEKIVFLEKSEIELIKLIFGNGKTTNKININKSTAENN